MNYWLALLISIAAGFVWAATYSRTILIAHLHVLKDDPHIPMVFKKERYHLLLGISHISLITGIIFALIYLKNAEEPLIATGIGIVIMLLSIYISETFIPLKVGEKRYHGGGRPRRVVWNAALGHTIFVGFIIAVTSFIWAVLYGKLSI